ncbi:putative NADH-flavin reductase [Pedobacter cryoconitis]|uniref:Putative NADH-flavin reductase n=1 Tax=Pedobacter cryoconitis TaxID=188932 RepID=A0A7W8YNW9_9SPHI|nr:NAD(P)H-binding protein [Pedobacter cryoconitis]MBB5619081.1 putative NADH-flavin reductase [Pedobacter cryoconitis]MBB5644375.1 putative NADH-flavin reductase [Pedobacter cryoconitis]
MKQAIKVALLGATGKAGQYLLQELLNNGYQVKSLIRKPKDYTLSHPALEIVAGDIKDPETAKQLIEGCDAIISAIGQNKDEVLISSLATENIINAMEEFKLSRYILLTGSNLEVPGDQKSAKNLAGTVWMKTTFPVIVEDKQKAYEILTASSIDWTIVRLPWIEETTERRGLVVDLKDCLEELISTTDLADFLIAQLTDTTYIKKAPFVASKLKL